MRGLVRAFAVVLIAVPVAASAHVAPDNKRNNRYIKVTPMGNRVRLAYTVYIGEIPGALARAEMDKNRDGALSEAESAAFGREIAAAVAKNLSFEIDGNTASDVWDEISVGLGEPITNAGSFSIDLVKWGCPSGGSEHSVVLYDRYEIDRPGETELRAEESPGVAIKRSTLGDEKPHRTEFEWVGGNSPLATLGYHLTYDVDSDQAVMVADAQCRPPQRSLWPYAAAGAGIALLAGVAIVAVRRRRR